MSAGKILQNEEGLIWYGLVIVNFSSAARPQASPTNSQIDK
jgi:hypothetical protein